MNKLKFLKKNKESGQGMVEYALVLPIFLMLVFFILDISGILYDKVAFNMALREAIFDIDFNDEKIAELKGILNPFGTIPNRYDIPYNPYTGERSNKERGKYYYMNDQFFDGLTVAEYLKKEIKANNPSIDVDRIEFLNFSRNNESKIGIYSGLQHYHYKTNMEADGKGYAGTPKFSTIVIAEIRAVYRIEPKGAFMKTIYPDGVPHEKVIFKSSRNFRWRPRVLYPAIPDELESLKNFQGGI